MAVEVGQHQVAAFSGPVDGDNATGASVKDNDDALREQVNDHDADETVHVQSSLLAARPVAGTAGRFWITTDDDVPRAWLDTGAAWVEVVGTIAGAFKSMNAITVSVTGATPYVLDASGGSGQLITVASGATIDLSTDIAAGVEFVVIDVTATRAAKFFAGFVSVDMTTADPLYFSATSGTASRTNVYCDSGAGNRVRLQNNTGGSRIYRITAVRY